MVSLVLLTHTLSESAHVVEQVQSVQSATQRRQKLEAPGQRRQHQKALLADADWKKGDTKVPRAAAARAHLQEAIIQPSIQCRRRRRRRRALNMGRTVPGD